MARRSSLNPNAAATPGDYSRASEWSSIEAEADRQDIRADAAAGAAALGETVTQRETDARREVPRTVDTAANPRMSRSFPSASAERPMLSSNRKKSYNKAKVEWDGNLPKTRHASMTRTVGNPERLEGVNNALYGVVGMRSELPPGVRRRVSEIDRSIQDYETNNPRQHIVYATLRAPRDSQGSRDSVQRELGRMTERPDSEAPNQQNSLTFDGYVPSTHSLGNIPDGDDIVMEIRTRSGAYLGSSDTTPNADHLVGRGRVLRPVGMQDVEYVKPNGARGTRRVVQMDDVTPA